MILLISSLIATLAAEMAWTMLAGHLLFYDLESRRKYVLVKASYTTIVVFSMCAPQIPPERWLPSMLSAFSGAVFVEWLKHK